MNVLTAHINGTVIILPGKLKIIHGEKLFMMQCFSSLHVIILMWNTLNGKVKVGGQSLDYGPNANSRAKKRWCHSCLKKRVMCIFL